MTKLCSLRFFKTQIIFSVRARLVSGGFGYLVPRSAGFGGAVCLVRQGPSRFGGRRTSSFHDGREKLGLSIYYGASILFCVLWAVLGRNRWFIWSVAGSTFILVFTYFMVQINVWVNSWYGEFFDLIQKALSEESNTLTVTDYYSQIITVVFILVPTILARVLFSYFVQHYVFRWRTAMNNYYSNTGPNSAG